MKLKKQTNILYNSRGAEEGRLIKQSCFLSETFVGTGN